MMENTRFLNWQDKMASREGSRQSFNLQLDWDKPEDVELIKTIAFLKDKQDFSKVMKMALKIIPAMMYESSLDELFSEFTWAKLEMLEYMKELQGGQEKSTNNAAATRNDIERLEKLLLQQSSAVAVSTNDNGNGNGGLKPITGLPQNLNVSQLKRPTFEDDDDDLELTVTKADISDSNASANFLASMMALQEN